MKTEWISTLEQFLAGNDFGKNWDGVYQDAVPAIRRFFHEKGFSTEILSEWDTPSRHTELVATKLSLIVRIPWGLDANGLSLVDLNVMEVHSQPNLASQ
jgi:hypothetical protein